MVCASCGHYCHAWRWHSEWRESGAANPAWISWTADTSDPRLFWYRVCWPTCRANARFESLLTAEHQAFLAISRLQSALSATLEELAWWWQWDDS